MSNRFEYDELVYDGAVAEVHHVGLRMPDGQVVPRDLISPSTNACGNSQPACWKKPSRPTRAPLGS